MDISIVVWINMSILFSLALLHCYWAVGGKWGFEAALPTKADGHKALQPSDLACFVVALALMTFAYFHYSYLRTVNLKSLSGYILLAGSLIFASRAIGDFNYVGFFKRVKGTKFARQDSRIFSPLCLIISALSFVVWLMG